MNIHADWATEAGTPSPAASLSEGRSLAGALHGFGQRQKPADRWPSMAIVIAIHLLAAWAVIHATMTAINKPVAEQTITVTIAESEAKPMPPAPEQPRLPQLPTLMQVVTPPDANAPTIQVAVAPAPAAVEVSPPVPPAPPAPKAPAEPTVISPSFDAAYRDKPAVYPNMSRRLRETGTVQLRVRVSADGVPQEILLAVSSRYPRLDEAARDAVKQWHFQPAMRGGAAVEAWVLVPIEFSLGK